MTGLNKLDANKLKGKTNSFKLRNERYQKLSTMITTSVSIVEQVRVCKKVNNINIAQIGTKSLVPR